MTCIVGLVDKKGIVYIGGDSCGSGGSSQQTVHNAKVFRVNKFIIGCTSSFRMIDILTYDLSLPELDTDINKYMRTTFISKVKDAFFKGGYGKVKEGDYNEGGNFLVGVSGRLFEVQNDFSVLDCEEFGNSVGCGRQAARGSLYTTLDSKLKPDERILIALSAAEACCTGVRGPFVVLRS